MSNKTRDISPYEFLQALQKEYICLEIRSKIYVHKNDKEYFKKLMSKKEPAIRAISRKNRIANVLDEGEEYLRVWEEIVPKFGLPRFIYNIINVSEKQLTFPYKGTAVQINYPNKKEYGICEQVIFEDDEILVRTSEGRSIYSLQYVKRLDHKLTDEFFYYYPNNQFVCNDHRVGVLKTYDLDTKIARISFENEEKWISLHRDDISRML